ncbi:MAG: FAD-dependent oxidoreductase [Myxococcota bacterium]
MKKFDIVIIGSSAAGLTAAITARRHYPEKTMGVIRKNNRVPIPCGIPYTFGIVGSADKNLIPVDNILEKNKVANIIGDVTRIDRNQKIVKIDNNNEIEYEKLIIATGSKPFMPPIKGSDKDNVFVIKKDVNYLEKVIAAAKKAKNLTIVGCGFIGVEMAEECKRGNKNLTINIVEMRERCLQLVYDQDLCKLAEEKLQEQDINLILNEKIESFEGDNLVESVSLGSGKKIDSDMVIIGTGAVPNSTLAQEAGLEINKGGAIKVNRYMLTSDNSILSCGDCAEKFSFFDGQSSNMMLASIATTEARIAGANLFNTSRFNPGVLGVYSTVIGGHTFATAGLTSREAEEKGFKIITGESEAINRHPGSMPGAQKMKVKLIFDAGSQVLIGGQICGAKSGGELINAVSACIQQKMTADQIATFQTGTHPALTASPIAYQLVNAAELAITKQK